MFKISLLIVFIFLGICPNRSEKKVSVGFKTDAVLSNLLSNERTTSTDMRMGGAIGPLVIIHCSDKLAIQTELCLTFQMSKFSDSDCSYFESWGMEFPVYLLRKINVNSHFKFIAGSGVFIEHAFTSSISELQQLKRNHKENFSMNRFNYGPTALVGIDIFNQLELYVSYRIGLKNMSKSVQNEWIRSQRINFGIGFHF